MSMELKIGLDVITSYRRLAYSPWHAIAEFVDNSTQSYFDNRKSLDAAFEPPGERLVVSVVYDAKNNGGLLRVSDNAMGMSLEELERAMHVGLRPKSTTGRSKYGMGMKTAACWIGNKWSVKTKRLGEAVEHNVSVDVSAIAKGEGELPYKQVKNKSKDAHYTVIEIRDHNRRFQGRTLGKIRDFLRSMYRVDLREGLMILSWQGERLTWESMEEKMLVAKDGKKYYKDYKFKVDGKDVFGWAGVLERGSRANAGFSILHANRVVRGWPDSWRPASLYGQIQGSNDLVNQRLVGEINLDAFDVSHTKDDILWLGSQEEEVERGLLKHCGEYKEIARRYRKTKDDERGPSEVETSVAIDEVKRELLSPEMVDQISIEVVPTPELVERAVEDLSAKVTDHERETFRAEIGGVNVKVYVTGELSPNDPYVVPDVPVGSEVVVIVNTSHPHWGQLKASEGVANYLRHCIYDALAEWRAMSRTSKLDPGTIKLIKDRLLRVSFEIERHEEEELAGEPQP